MDWIAQLREAQPVAHAIIVLALAAMLGLAFGSIKIRGISLGIAGVLFAGIFLGHLGFSLEPGTLALVKELGLVTFVYTIGLQVGPGFLNALRRQGLALNVLAGLVVFLGAALCLALAWLLDVDRRVAVGIFTGATTNTPALGAAQEALRTTSPGGDGAAQAAIGYAVAYPFGILGIILSMLVLKRLLRIDVPRELEALQRQESAGREPVIHKTLVVQNRNLAGITVDEIPGKDRLSIVVSRLRRAGEREAEPATPGSALQLGDTILAVGRQADLEQFRLIVGQESAEDLLATPGRVTYRRVVLTRKSFHGRSLSELGFELVHGVRVTRVTRADLELSASPELRLHFGDMLRIVGTEEALAKATEALGNSVKDLNHTDLIPVSLGVALGILLGILPLVSAGLPAPLKLGLAGGPLIVAIVLSNIGRIGPLLWYMPVNANLLLRELGIVLFLSCVGLQAGGKFLHALLHGSGFLWMALGALVTVVPILVVALLARRFHHTNFLTLCGLLAGSMTDPPALAFASSISSSDAPSIAYAAVYPFSMLLRIFTAQALVVLFCG